ncbi:aspartate-semialdehyde dehydrogenase [Toxoplasma gondii TgCatPRC2]|uniref:Aspartate-semialdehyde dehydrogenase n=9 Tax=Toxoplasma gondii TaxID=5811 RepID=A0A0F7V0L5_TOXGV|nr:aspartate-semialdehyde dehydrogenase [Toxoplasma gondii ME49]ESS33222.1 aspartate-semialdehyde dehydrogenase [Toxoplasma gondii VEG]KFG33660.1 aspartate-semialdehyde dehydrogenase [Toxoplasma gondii p89]KFG38225.1 aspartate-semialdehyde dehydrogenase [Toxoplasma gondii GAB2-2007-GAL-DOM2]KFH00468.1 aspartate-semialdehyde dehydrogenase [Toxoplasma gondii VAND]KFH07567.1 aspartate-semialdehyde dehydrogenase [Toxoplasma gondii MAS]KYF44444.1 aspartate-semialdehyde dehydrogenase [Toxoplasma go|eukprot:XP_002367773.1 aspartate-semialdehyde dehydrogenase [Toxoplasma gondii ME49]
MEAAGRDDHQFTSAARKRAGPTLSCERKVNVGILGATGAVGQRFVSLLHGHPYFRITAVAASARSAGKAYGDVVEWRLDDTAPLTDEIRGMTVIRCEPDLFKEKGCVIIFSALDAAAATELESLFAASGFMVFSNAKSHRMDADVPILLPYVNAPLLDVVRSQPHYSKTGGAIVTNSNCASAGISVALKPLLDKWGIARLSIATLQAISGAGYPGLSALDMIDNVIPHISGEEEKLESEPQKILGTLSDGSTRITSATFESVAMCHRVPVIDGHIVTVTVDFPPSTFPNSANPDTVSTQVSAALRGFRPPPNVAELPSCPDEVLFSFASIQTGPNRALIDCVGEEWQYLLAPSRLNMLPVPPPGQQSSRRLCGWMFDSERGTGPEKRSGFVARWDVSES